MASKKFSDCITSSTMLNVLKFSDRQNNLKNVNHFIVNINYSIITLGKFLPVIKMTNNDNMFILKVINFHILSAMEYILQLHNYSLLPANVFLMALWQLYRNILLPLSLKV